MLVDKRSGKLSNALNLHVGTEREGGNTNASTRRGVLGEVLVEAGHISRRCLEATISPSAYLLVDLVHGREVLLQVGEEDVALQDGAAVDPSALEDFGHVVEGSTLQGRTKAHERDEDMGMWDRKTHSLRLDTTRDELELAVNANAARDVDRLSGDDGLSCSNVILTALSATPELIGIQ